MIILFLIIGSLGFMAAVVEDRTKEIDVPRPGIESAKCINTDEMSGITYCVEWKGMKEDD